jgi:hypothetical protein
MTMQPRSAQPQINVIHRFDASTILKMRIALRSSEETEHCSLTRLAISRSRKARIGNADLPIPFSHDQLHGCIAPMRFD